MATPLSELSSVPTRPEMEPVNILLVDDQPARLLTYESILAELGHNLVSCNSGFEALQQLMKSEFAVVLLDVSMPGMDGFEAARLIHTHPRFERTPIIFVTGVHVSELDRLQGYKLGAVDYVSIPLVPEILRGKVAVLAELYLKRRELQSLNRVLADANERLAEANSTLQVEKNRELQSLALSLQRTNAELAATNDSLQSEIAERKRVEVALKDADRQKDEFLATLSHELRNPLAAIHNAVEVMRQRPAADEQLLWARGIVERQLKDLRRLVDDLLDVSRITRGKLHLSREPVALGMLIKRAIETAAPAMEERGHQLTVHCEDESIVIHGDPTRLNQALANVLGNAAKYTDPGGIIEVTAQSRGGLVEIRVRDNGIGIAPDHLPRIFDLFTQSARHTDRSQAGLGIGLALVQRLVDMHGGNVWAQSAGVGKGSEFGIRLPVLTAVAEELGVSLCGAAPEQPEPVRDGNDHTAAGETPARRILLVDDNQDALESLALLLELGGHVVHKALTGAEALAAAERQRPELVLLDIGLPDLDGYEVARQLRAQPWGRELTLIALTGWGQESDRRRSQEAGFDAHLVKPLDPNALNEWLVRSQAPGEPRRGVAR